MLSVLFLLNLWFGGDPIMEKTEEKFETQFYEDK